MVHNPCVITYRTILLLLLLLLLTQGPCIINRLMSFVTERVSAVQVLGSSIRLDNRRKQKFHD